MNRRAVNMLVGLRQEFEKVTGAPFVISACIGPRGDGYSPDTLIGPDEAQRYHATQITTFTDTEADMVTALTMPVSAPAMVASPCSAGAAAPTTATSPPSALPA